MKVIEIKNGKTKPPSPRRQNQVLNTIKHPQDISLWKSTRTESPFLPFNEPNSFNDCIFIDQKYNDQLFFFNQVDSNMEMFDNVVLKRVIVQPTKKSRRVGPHKSKSKSTTNKKKSCLKNNKFRSVSTQLRKGSTKLDNDGTNIQQKHLFYTNEYPKNYPFINIDASIPNVTWKLTKNCSHIISNRLLSGYSSYSGNNQRYKLHDESSSMSASHIELLYHLTRILLLTSKIIRPEVLDCVTYILTIMELPINYYKYRNLNTDLLITKKTQMFVLSSTEDQCSYFETCLGGFTLKIVKLLTHILYLFVILTLWQH